MFYAYRNVNQVIPSGIWTQVQLNAELFDALAEFDAVTNYRFVPNKAGYYCLIANVRFAVLPIGIVGQLRLQITGATVSLMSVIEDGVFNYRLKAMWFGYMLPTDRAEIEVRQNSGVNQNIITGWDSTHLSGFRVK